MREKANFPFKTTKISNSTMKEARTLLIEVAASSADPIQRWDHSVLKGDVNIVGVASILGHQMLILLGGINLESSPAKWPPFNQ
jgi:hypothetical protein